ncbi:MAG: TSUP family transporter [Pseudohongiellaceae bacterium]
MLPDFSFWQFALTALIFIWAGFVRSGLGFGGAALGLPFMLLVYDQPIYWIPIIGSHLLFFSALTLRTRLSNVDWAYLKRSGALILPAAVAGVFGLIKLPNEWLLIFIYGITMVYAVLWALDKAIHSQSIWVDRALLLVGGYVSGTSLTGAPLMIAVFMRNVSIGQLRNTLFVLWFIIVTIKLVTLAAFAVPLNTVMAAVLIPVASIGHVAGLKLHDYIMARDSVFRRMIGGFLILVCLIGLGRLLIN